MHPLDPVPAVRRIETDRPDAFAFEIAGHVTSADVENLYGLLEAAYALHDRIDLLVRIVDYDGIDWSEVSDETVEIGKEHAIAHVRRCAAIGSPDWTTRLGGFFAPAIPIELKHFENEADAWDWIEAKPVEDA
ncbi:STAS/SEC14 domain-containing protein [Mesorhizobium sp. SB112]|uniref:STAS/SEC14 domain-containing protein n=1 Tax=Mesorhizobium sp. SB112 TaxID=3151853 RepID=UPI0032676255